MNKMKAIIKQFFLNGVGKRFFQSAFDKFKIQGRQHKRLNSKQNKVKLKRNRFLKYRRWVFFPQMLRVIHLIRPCHILFLLPSSPHDVRCQNQQIKRLIRKGYKVRRV